ncbi:MAG: hypothetical protein JRJ87_25020 [Deltaproteobacteria bacterium]|nr:hypothetical protein [Deltaproteobacteria bacterium]
MMRKTKISGTQLLSVIEKTLAKLLPASWSVAVKPEVRLRNVVVDAVLKLRAPDRKTAKFAVEIKNKLEPRDVGRVVKQARASGLDSVLVAAGFLGPRARELLVEAGASYLDATGNVRLVLDRPALFICTDGSTINPWREERALVSLKGPSSARVIRALCDFLPPYGVRELSEKAGSSLGSTSRVLSFLEREAIVQKEKRGRVVGVDWATLLRRWAQDYVFETAHTLQTFLNPNTQASLNKKLKNLKSSYAVTAAPAANLVAPVAAVRLTTVFVKNIPASAVELGLREIDAGANVILAEPLDPVVFERTWRKGGIVYAALSQVAADLMTSPGRGPAEADALMRWMGKHENDWRT